MIFLPRCIININNDYSYIVIKLSLDAQKLQPSRGLWSPLGVAPPRGAVIHQLMSGSILKLSVTATLQYFIRRVAHSQEEESETRRIMSKVTLPHFSAPAVVPVLVLVLVGHSLRAHSLRLLRQAALCNLSLMMSESNLSSSRQADSGSVVCEAAASGRTVTSSAERERGGFYSVFLLSSTKEKAKPGCSALSVGPS